MKKYLICTGLMAFLGGCADTLCDQTPRQCGSPCPHLMPQAMDEDTLLGSYQASALGRKLERDNQVAAAKVLQNLLRTGALEETFCWQPRGACAGDVFGSFRIFHPTRQGSAHCLDYLQTLTLDKVYKAKGTACRGVNGTWRIVEEIPYEIH